MEECASFIFRTKDGCGTVFQNIIFQPDTVLSHFRWQCFSKRASWLDMIKNKCPHLCLLTERKTESSFQKNMVHVSSGYAHTCLTHSMGWKIVGSFIWVNDVVLSWKEG